MEVTKISTNEYNKSLIIILPYFDRSLNKARLLLLYWLATERTFHTFEKKPLTSSTLKLLVSIQC
jgi:hypothetical protein